ncbi:MAG: hypothetical protein ABIZ81_14470 [Opitutaceae bacterium]
MTLHEPATFATDCVLAVWSVWLGTRLKGSTTAALWWRRTFFWTAAAGLSGGIYHGFGPSMADAADGLWRGTLIAINITSLCLTLAAAHATLKRGLAWCRAVAWVKAVCGVFYSMTHPVFLSAIIDYGSAMVFVLVVELYAWWGSGARHARWVVAGILASVIGAAVQQLHWVPHPRFNHNDLYHVIQMVGLWLFYRGARMLS